VESPEEGLEILVYDTSDQCVESTFHKKGKKDLIYMTMKGSLDTTCECNPSDCVHQKGNAEDHGDLMESPVFRRPTPLSPNERRSRTPNRIPFADEPPLSPKSSPSLRKTPNIRKRLFVDLHR
jgi:hypothetical protein